MRQPAGHVERVGRHRRARGKEVVRPLPVELGAEDRALRAQPVVERRAAQRPHGDEFLARPAHRVVEAERFHRAVGQVAAVRVEGREAPDVDVPDVERRLAAGDPLGDQASGAARVRDAGGVESGADEVAADLGRLAQDEVAVAGEALRPVEEHLDLRGLEARRAVDRVLHQHLELVPVLRQQLELEAVRDGRHVPRLGDGFEATHHESADFLLVVDEAVRIADHGQVGCHAGDRFRDDVEVLGGVERHVDAGAPPELARPLSAAVDERRAGDLAALVAARPGDAGHAAVVQRHAVDLHALEDAGAARPRTLRERLRQVRRIGLAVARNPHGAREVVGAQDRRDALRLGRRHVVERDAEALRARHLALDQRQPFRRLRDVEAAALLPAGREPGLGLQRRVELDAVLAHARRVARRPRLADQSRRMPSRAAGELALLEQHDVRDAELGEVVGGRHAGDAAADDHDLRMGWQCGHGAAEDLAVAERGALQARVEPQAAPVPRHRSAIARMPKCRRAVDRLCNSCPAARTPPGIADRRISSRRTGRAIGCNGALRHAKMPGSSRTGQGPGPASTEKPKSSDPCRCAAFWAAGDQPTPVHRGWDRVWRSRGGRARCGAVDPATATRSVRDLVFRRRRKGS